MRRLEQGAAVLMIVLAGVVAFGTAGLPIWSDFSPGDRFVPLAVAGLTLVLAVAFLFETRRRPADEAANLPKGRDAARVLGGTGAIAAFAALAPFLGFVVGGAVFVLAMLLLVLRRRLVPSLLAAAITTGIVHGIFVAWLGIRLPTGIPGV